MSVPQRLLEGVEEQLQAKGVPCLLAYPTEDRQERQSAFLLLGLERFEGESAGFTSYRGSRPRAGGKDWEEVYGQRVRVVLSLTLCCPRKEGEAGTMALMEQTLQALEGLYPAGLTPGELVWEEVKYDGSARLFRRKGLLECSGLVYAPEGQAEDFLQFEVRGGITLA